MRTVAALAIAAAGYKSAALFAATVSFPWLGVSVLCLAVSIAVLTSNRSAERSRRSPTTYRR